MKEHMITHRSYECNKCSFRTKLSRELPIHMKTHDKAKADIVEPPRECIKEKDKDDSVSCSLCKLESKNLDSLRTHIENVHGEEVTNHETLNCDDIVSQTYCKSDK